MPLTPDAVAELKEIHRQETGEVLSDDEVWEMADRLLRLIDVLTRPEPLRDDILHGSNRVPG